MILPRLKIKINCIGPLINKLLTPVLQHDDNGRVGYSYFCFTKKNVMTTQGQ